MKFTSLVIFVLLFFISSGCSTVDPTAGKNFDVKSKTRCIQICEQAEMKFQALVVVAGMAGCVCENNDSKKVSSTSAVMGGAVAALIQEQQRAAAQRR